MTRSDCSAATLAAVNDIEMYYATYGDPANPALLLLHGGLGNADYFVNQIPVFTEHFYVITADSRGHGRSTMSDQQIGYALMASDVLALADALGIEQILGGRAVGPKRRLCLDQPPQERHLVLVHAFAAPATEAG